MHHAEIKAFVFANVLKCVTIGYQQRNPFRRRSTNIIAHAWEFIISNINNGKSYKEYFKILNISDFPIRNQV